MANEIALRVLGEPGDELVAEENAHLLIAELGGPAVHAGLMTRPLPARAGRFTTDQVRAPLPDAVTSDTCRRPASSRSRTRTTPPAAASGRSPRLPRWRKRAASSSSACTSTARASSTPQSRAGRRRRRSPATATRSRSASRRASAVRSARSSPAQPSGCCVRGASSISSAGRCGRRESSPRRASTRSTTTSTGWPTTTRAPGASPRHSHEAGVPVDLEQVETNFVQVDVGSLGLEVGDAIERLLGEGIRLSGTRAAGAPAGSDAPRHHGRGHRAGDRGGPARARRPAQRSPATKNAQPPRARRPRSGRRLSHGSTDPARAALRSRARRAADDDDLDRAEGERERVDRPREQGDRRNQEDGDLGARGECDLRGELDAARGRRRRPRRRARPRCRRSRRSPLRRRTR